MPPPLRTMMKKPSLLPAGNKRIVVIGTTGSGKTMLAQAIAKRHAIPHLELDALYWGPDWTPFPLEQFRASVEEATQGDNWVVDGNHGAIRDIVWPRANTLIWLDYALPVIFWHLTKRTTQRLITRQELWQGNRETLQNQFMGRIAARSLRRALGREDPADARGAAIDDESVHLDSSSSRALNAHQRRRAIYPQLLDSPLATHLIVIILRSPKEASRWLGAGESR